MIPEIGHFALILALVVAVVQTVVPLLGSALGNPALDWLGKTCDAVAIAVHADCLCLPDLRFHYA